MYLIGETINVELFKGKLMTVEKMKIIEIMKAPSGRETHYKLLNKEGKEYIKSIKNN